VSPWDLLGVSGLVVGGVAAWLLLVLFGLMLARAAGQRTPAPPAGPRGRLLLDRERAGRVEVLPTVGDAENGQKWPER
jgi:hypothetical protein